MDREFKSPCRNVNIYTSRNLENLLSHVLIWNVVSIYGQQLLFLSFGIRVDYKISCGRPYNSVDHFIDIVDPKDFLKFYPQVGGC